MKKEIRVASYMRVGNQEQLIDPIDYILARAKRGEIKTLVVGTLERFCDDPVRREELIKELGGYGVEIVTAFDGDKSSRKCAIYNRYSTDVPERLAEMREKLITYCKEILGIDDYELFEEVGSVLEKREVFDGMMARIGQGEFSDILAYHIDRLQKYDYAALLETVEKLCSKVVIHTMSR